MKCDLKFDVLSLDQWHKRFAALPRSTILQSYDYGRSVMGLYGQKPAWGIIEIDGVEAGLFQIAQASILWGAFHAVILDRGPLWFEGFGNDGHICAFIQSYSNKYPKRFGRKRRIIPEWAASRKISAELEKGDWQLVNGTSYQTHWIDVSLPVDDLRKNLRKSWRQSLQKAEKSDLVIQWDQSGKMLPLHLKHYMLDKAKKSYEGPDVKIIQALSIAAAKGKNLLIGTALLDNQPIAGILVITHGRSATYQIGWSSERGKTACAHHRLLFEGAQKLSSLDIKDFDLGGMNETTAKSIKTFKTGMGGETITLAGLYT